MCGDVSFALITNNYNMLKKILSIAGRPGLFRLVNQGKNMLIVESLANGKRTPAYAHDKVVSLGDISIYTNEGDVPLTEVLEAIRVKNDSKPIDLKSFGSDAAIRAYFAEILPSYDRDRVHASDIKKLLSWYNILVSNGITDFVEQNAVATEEPAAEEGK